MKHEGKKRVVSLINTGDAEMTLTVTGWKVQVYVKSRDITVMNEQLKSGLGGQQKFRCPFHDSYLVKQFMSCTISCCIQDSTRSVRWLCQGSNPVSCLTGLCFAHGSDLLKIGTITDVRQGMTGRRLPLRPARVRRESSSSESNGDDLDERILAPLRLGGMMEAEDCPPVQPQRYHSYI